MSRGLANCNPGNIRRSKVRYRGEQAPSRDPDFKQFRSLDWGYRAIFVLLDTYRIRYSISTLRTMIARWAPPTENHTELYIRTVARLTGIDADRPLDTRSAVDMIPVAAAISQVENGTAADTDALNTGWELFAAEKADQK